MTTATRSVAVVATRLPITDRRALSQAWYSALHMTQAQPGNAARKTAPATPKQAPGAQSARATACKAPAPASSHGRVYTGRAAVPPPLTERRGPTTELSRRIEKALARRVVHPAAQPQTLAIKAGDGRVQLLVRTDGATTRVVALCAPHLRERVDRALAHARFALAADGARIESAIP